jgi:hypothetical protein
VQIDYADGSGGYRPGACNIGPEEIARRRRSGLAAVGVGLAIAVVLVLVGAPVWTRVVVFPFLAGGFVSLEQARRRFCVGFAMAGLRNFGPLSDPDHVTDLADRAADRRAALLMTAYCAALAAIPTIALLFVAT